MASEDYIAALKNGEFSTDEKVPTLLHVHHRTENLEEKSFTLFTKKVCTEIMTHYTIHLIQARALHRHPDTPIMMLKIKDADNLPAFPGGYLMYYKSSDNLKCPIYGDLRKIGGTYTNTNITTAYVGVISVFKHDRFVYEILHVVTDKFSKPFDTYAAVKEKLMEWENINVKSIYPEEI